MHHQAHAVQMGTHNICLYRQKYIGCNLETKKLLDCVLIGLCVVIRSNLEGHLVGTEKTWCGGVDCATGAGDVCKCTEPYPCW